MAFAAELFDLSDRVAIVTGAGGGLGRAFAEALASAGAVVTAADLSLPSAEETARLIRDAGGKASSVEVDVREPASVESLFERVGGDVSIIINNAGIATLPVRTHEHSVEDWDRLMAVNLRGVFLCSRLALKAMLPRRRGAIVNIASIIGARGFYPGFAVTASNYAASKEAVIGFTRQMAVEYAGDGIPVNAICPGWHAGTDLGRERRGIATAEDVRRFDDAILTRVPLGRKGHPDELGSLVVYLCSDASRYVTGQAIFHDGGWTAA